MASVYLATASGPGGFEKPVAIKRMHPHLTLQREYVEMFLDEARISSRINHPNICACFDFGEEDETYYMAMEYLVGEPLTVVLGAVESARAVDSPLWRALCARIIVDACEGLHAAHELRDEGGEPLRVVHRDVTPSNIFVTFDGAVKIVDFGVAKAQRRLHQTSTGTLKGKFSYMSPEQVDGLPHDRRADVWSLGVCLWEMLTCQRLFRRKSEMETLRAVAEAPIPSPSDIVAGVPEEISAVVLKALQRNPDDRYQSARDMGRPLQAFIAQQGIPAGLAELAEYLERLLGDAGTAKREFVSTALNASDEELERGIALLTSGQVDDLLSNSVSKTRPVEAPQDASEENRVPETKDASVRPIRDVPTAVLSPSAVSDTPSATRSPATRSAVRTAVEIAEARTDPSVRVPVGEVSVPTDTEAPRTRPAQLPVVVLVAGAAALSLVAVLAAVGLVIGISSSDRQDHVSEELSEELQSSELEIEVVDRDGVMDTAAGPMSPRTTDTALPSPAQEPRPTSPNRLAAVRPSQVSPGAGRRAQAAPLGARDMADDESPPSGAAVETTPPSNAAPLEGADEMAESLGSNEGSDSRPVEPEPGGVERASDLELPDEAVPPTTRPTIARFGTVNLVTRGGWADIYMGGRRRGRTPQRMRLPAGRRTLFLHPFGQTPAMRVSLNVPAGGVSRRVVTLPAR